MLRLGSLNKRISTIRDKAAEEGKVETFDKTV
jgi:hypothetical protein